METTAANKKSQSSQPSKSSQIASTASRLVLISSLINNINSSTSKQDNIYVFAATIGLIASYLSKQAALTEANEQQVAPGVTTFANNLKIISSKLSLIAGVISYWALLTEVSLRAQGISAPQTPGASGNTTVTGSLLAQ